MSEAQFTIPTLPDLMNGIEHWMAERAKGETVPDDLTQEVYRVLDTPPRTADDLFKLMAFARGCHAVAEERRTLGDHGTAICFHYYGQVMLENAAHLLASIAVSELNRVGEARH